MHGKKAAYIRGKEGSRLPKTNASITFEEAKLAMININVKNKLVKGHPGQQKQYAWYHFRREEEEEEVIILGSASITTD